MAQLDKTKEYATIHGDELMGRRFFQNGKYFGSNGAEWVPPAVIQGEAATSGDVDAAYAKGMKDAMASIDAKIAGAVAAALKSAKPAAKVTNEVAKT